MNDRQKGNIALQLPRKPLIDGSDQKRRNVERAKDP